MTKDQLDLPQVKHIYQNHSIDSTRWDHYRPRDGDVIVATSIKAGTTWMSNIVLQLVFAAEPPVTIADVVMWPELRMMPLDDMIDNLESQKHRRIIKTHVPLDGLRFFARARYVVVGRDPRDVFMSLWNHYLHERPESIAVQNAVPGRVGPPLPECPPTLHDLWQKWINEGWFEWEQEGWPYWGNMRTYQLWWPYRNLDNVLLVHFNDLLADLPKEIAHIAEFLEIEASDDLLGKIAVSFPVKWTTLK